MQESEPRGPRYRRAHGGPSLSPRIGLTTEKHAYRIDCGKIPGGSFPRIELTLTNYPEAQGKPPPCPALSEGPGKPPPLPLCLYNYPR